MNTPIRAGDRAIALEVEERKSYFLYSCEKSLKQPLCDGSHKETELKLIAFKVDVTKKLFFCACKQTKNQSFCDGSHNK